jgi:hypothetical protein
MDGTPEDKSNGYRCNISNDATNVAFWERLFLIYEW